MKQKERVSQVGDELARDFGPVGVVIAQEAKAGIQAPALLAGLDQRDVKLGQPARVQTPHGFRERGAGSQLSQHLPDRLAVGARRGGALELLEGRNEAQPGRGQRGQLLVKRGAPRKLRGRDDEH
jgi:hypothetical protein